MRQMTAILALLAASAFLLATCVITPQATGPDIPPELRAIMEAGRAIALPPPHPDFARIAAGYLTPNLDAEADARVAAEFRRQVDPNFSIFNPRGIGRQAPPQPETLSHAEIAREINFFFDLLRSVYAGYQHFGGDGVFLPIRDSMLARLPSMPNPMPRMTYLQELLAPPLRGVIVDNHFGIHNVPFRAPGHWLYMHEDIVPRREGDGFVVELDGATHRVIDTTLPDGTSVNGILPTLTRDGEIAWAFARLASDTMTTRITAILENIETGQRRSLDLSLPWVENPAQTSFPLLETREEGGVKIMTTRSMVGEWSDERGFQETLDDFFRAGREARESPVLVLDLRGHGGGFIQLGYAWMRGFAGRGPAPEMAFMSYTLGSLSMVEFGLGYRSDVLFDPALPQPVWEMRLSERLRDPDPQPRWLSPDFGHLRELIPSDNIIIVLIDNNAGSSGEVFIGYLRQLENALFVGTNTRGVLVTGGAIGVRLPYSGFEVRLGTTLNLRPDFSQFEGVGFLPDLWVPPGESLERALAFIERYGLNSAR